MHRIALDDIKLKSADMIPVVEEILASGRNAKIIVYGDSMFPFLRCGIDSVVLSDSHKHSLRLADIVLIKDEKERHVLHRIVKKQASSFYVCGDAQQEIAGPYNRDNLIAVVTEVFRADKLIDCNSLSWRVYSFIWLWLLPFRRVIIRAYAKINKIIKVVFGVKNS